MFQLRSPLKSFFVLTLVLGSWLLFSPSHAAAAFNYTDYPIDDAAMRATGTMSAQDIQNFLTNQQSGLSVYTDIEDCGSPAGSHYSFYATYYHCGSRMSAAQIIYDSAQAYGINPQAILATLQKEQSLITTPNPTSSQLTYAMGYGCPDSGGCSYPGFFNQVDNGTWQFRVDMELSSGNSYWGYPPSSYPCNGPTRYYSAALKPGNNVTFFDDYGNAYIAFTIPNAATAALYCYTPHVYPGSGAQYYSGSYNFVYYFTRWFVPYSWQITSQYAYTDASKTAIADMGHLHPGDKVYVGFTARNTGNATWSNSGPNAVMVGTASPFERSSVFSAGSSWLSPTRPALLKESSVAPGSVGTFEFWLTIPQSGLGGPYNERFNLVANGLAWFNDTGLSFYVNFPRPTYTWQMTNQYVYTDATKTVPRDMANLRPGDKIYVGFIAKNTGNTTWHNSGSNPIRVGTLAPIERSSIFSPGSNWLGPSRAGNMLEASVPPGNTGTFEFWLTVPSLPGTYNERFGLVAEGANWMNDVGLSYYARIIPNIYTWQLVSQYVYGDSAKTVPRDMANLRPGDKIYVGFIAKNTGNTVWKNNGSNPIRVGTLVPIERSSIFSPGSNWLGSSRAANMTEASVSPGATGTFEFVLTVPSNQVGTYNERFGLVAEGANWMNDVGLSYYARIIQ